MTRAVYIAATDAATRKVTIALGIAELLSRRVGTIGVFRPVVIEGRTDSTISTLSARFNAVGATGVTYDDVHADPVRATNDIVAAYRQLAARCDAVIIVGTDYTDVGAATEFEFNAVLASHLGAPVLLLANGQNRSPGEIAAAIAVAHKELANEHATLLGTLVTRVAPDRADAVRARLGDTGIAVLPELARLSAPTVSDLMTGCSGTLFLGDGAQLGREVSGLMVGAMSLPHILERLTEGVAVIIPSDRAAGLLPALLAAHTAATFPALSAIIMTGGMDLPEPVVRLVDGMEPTLPVILTGDDTFEVATELAAIEGRFSPEATGKIDTALRLFAEHVRGEELLDRLHVTKSAAVTPLMFEYDLIERARSDRRTIVLPEGDDPRILRAADILLRRGVADLTLLGERDAVTAQAASLGLDLSAARILSPFDPELRERFAAEYAEQRAHKGVSVALARDTVTDVSYFGTLMVRLGLADGMVSGANHTTAHTIRPSFEVIRTAPGAKVVSSVFFMCLEDRVLVYGDCAVNPDPTAEQLADIAIQSATTAAAFGVEPRIAMLSYSTGTSGTGAEVDKVRAATELVRRLRPDLPVEGPIQYDAAADPTVARAKMPESPVAGRATVFIVPDLNTGNNLYKAVQRSAGAVAVGPVLQGLRKPVNDLSRGATVQDIVNTVAITAIQAQGERA
ncbi:phosphate acetyltransferase [Actinocorallia longicatena]|uniref:Phosphate acetyltransferase n=1 Tax=Actinocorallia longicatena TaxID=111803 RepID=A0ABP6Q8P5_9ACTN